MKKDSAGLKDTSHSSRKILFDAGVLRGEGDTEVSLRLTSQADSLLMDRSNELGRGCERSWARWTL